MGSVMLGLPRKWTALRASRVPSLETLQVLCNEVLAISIAALPIRLAGNKLTTCCSHCLKIIAFTMVENIRHTSAFSNKILVLPYDLAIIELPQTLL